MYAHSVLPTPHPKLCSPETRSLVRATLTWGQLSPGDSSHLGEDLVHVFSFQLPGQDCVQRAQHGFPRANLEEEQAGRLAQATPSLWAVPCQLPSKQRQGKEGPAPARLFPHLPSDSNIARLESSSPFHR